MFQLIHFLYTLNPYGIIVLALMALHSLNAIHTLYLQLKITRPLAIIMLIVLMALHSLNAIYIDACRNMQHTLI